jgi:hypothetical protein
MPAPVQLPHFVHPMTIGGRWAANDSLYLVLAQLNHPTEAEILGDRGRPHAVAAIQALFTGHESTTGHNLDGGTHPRVVIAPELAIGSADWPAIDDAVRRSRGDTLLVVGCGFVSGQWIQDWMIHAAAPTARLVGWPAEREAIATARHYNVGFVWIKGGTECRCVLFLKNFTDQSLELGAQPDLEVGQWMVRLEADDLIVFPTICSDLLAHIAGAAAPGSAAKRIRRSLEASPANGKRVLVTGSLLTPKPGDGLWSRAVVHLADNVGPGHLLALANAACTVKAAGSFPCFVASEEDRWRNRTGVFKPRPGLTEPDRSPAQLTLILEDNNVVASVVRETFALIQGGFARWSGSLTNGAYLWHPTARAILDVGGSITSISSDDPLAYEAARLALRHGASQRPNPAQAGADDPFVQQQHACASFKFDGANSLATSLCSPNNPWPARLVRTVVSGLHTTTVDLKPFTDNPTGWPQLNHLCEGLDAVALVSHTVAPEWEPIPDFDDRAMHQGPSGAFVVWSSPFHTRHDMDRAISTWQSSAADARKLVVIGQSKNHEFEEGAATQPLPREDIGQPEAAAAERDITAKRRNREVTRIRLGRLREACEPVLGDHGDVRGRVMAVLGIAAT